MVGIGVKCVVIGMGWVCVGVLIARVRDIFNGILEDWIAISDRSGQDLIPTLSSCISKFTYCWLRGQTVGRRHMQMLAVWILRVRGIWVIL